MSRPMTRMMTTAVATKAAPASDRRWGLRGTTGPTGADRREAGDAEGAEQPTPFWEYYCLAFC